MSTSLIRGKYVIARVLDNDTSEIISNGAVFQRDGEIIDVGRYDDLKARYTPDEEIGSDKYLVMPGMINAHEHSGFTPFQMGVPDLPLEPWIIAKMGARGMDPYLDSIYAAIKMIESGVTNVMHNRSLWHVPKGSDPVGAGFEMIRGYQDAGMRVAFSYSFRNQNRVVYEDDDTFLSRLPGSLASRYREYLGAGAVSQETYFATVTDIRNRVASDPRVTHIVSPANVQWCSDDFFSAAKEYAKRFKTGLHIHLQETVYQKMYGLKTWGKTPLAHLHDIGFTGPELSCGHGTWLTESDLDILAKTGTIICHNAASNLRLKSGIAPLNNLLAKGVNLAIGIDEVSINDDKDMLQEMRLIHKLHRLPGMDAPSPTSHQVFRMATEGGARATILADKIGTLEKGKRADVVLVDLSNITEPYLHPDIDAVDALLYRGRGVDVDTVIVDGEVLMRDRKLTRINKEEIWAEIRERMSRPLQPHEIERAQLGAELQPYVYGYYRQWQHQVTEPYYYYNEIV
jgi:5-methylthioadenosine/S-adenosylhomocysteine deaminase